MHTGNLFVFHAGCDVNATPAVSGVKVGHPIAGHAILKGPMDRENRASIDEIHLRILRVTEDLRAIQRELNCAAMQAPNDPELPKLQKQIAELPRALLVGISHAAGKRLVAAMLAPGLGDRF